ncbi:uncharacterized protein K444DRAFT_614868 [Hyaloscypha bicolor E]|uniref:DUF7704 domain-containing protein n=1 Tax=Hyaloscypha bicolor E TaxID=1095630 RepID=A0A2J6T3H3_9HELO|nr:uncharacterized protein K444DRAFT_614868 [Hyaloscypha bicolor E]PMD57463.1 hypothetical protein K444DRAFT_614868 [Hyaloscypha bicolor E]
MTSILPPFPRFVMCIFEPIATAAGFTLPFLATELFAAEQIPGSPVEAISDNTRMLALQLGNIYLLLAMVAVAVLYSTTEPKVVRNYVIALWLADIGHIATTGYVMGYDKFIDLANYNPTTWGNVGLTAFLCATRTAYLLGLFGPDRKPLPADKKGQ